MIDNVKLTMPIESARVQYYGTVHCESYREREGEGKKCEKGVRHKSGRTTETVNKNAYLQHIGTRNK